MATADRDGANGRHGAPGEGYGPAPVRRGRSTRRRTAGRAAALSAALLLAAMPLIALADERPYTTIDPMSEAADDIQGLYKLIFYLTIVVFVGVQALILYTALRFRQKRRLANRPQQIHGNSRLEIGWTIAPAVVLLAIFVFTVPVMYSEADEANDEEGALVVEVYGKQWWWEIHYPGLGPNGSDLITANEIRLPAGQKVVFHLYTNNVIHSFWVPQLAGKMDVMPGYRNKLAFTPEVPGDYYGECAEFCGTSHAWMRFKVIVEPPDQFNGWVAAWNGPPGGELAQAPPAFGQCIACHKVNGTSNANVAEIPVGYEGAYTAGPNLTLFGCRETLAGGLLINNEENLRAWLHDPASVKEGNLMATVIKEGALDDQQIDELVAYLLSLKLPDGTCPPDQGIPGSSATPVTAAAPADPAVGDVVASSE